MTVWITMWTFWLHWANFYTNALRVRFLKWLELGLILGLRGLPSFLGPGNPGKGLLQLVLAVRYVVVRARHYKRNNFL